ncbi:hypothetical protein BDV30DRAFT_224309 [Aspergillus minisclerotigenes]|uniref:Uncharacterized protein n=1 Tax=Aspergillus minisclerotigenes TaxID=656917 RepID=A0A5N6JFC5_9EURO|nr:hypothetical protein BDV30DRAFT_224309 [Aspergillus minisclerotigenes]
MRALWFEDSLASHARTWSINPDPWNDGGLERSQTLATFPRKDGRTNRRESEEEDEPSASDMITHEEVDGPGANETP